MKKPLKPIPKFRSTTAERKFLRLPVDWLERIKVEANRRDVPYQSLIKVWLDERAG